MPPGKGSEPDSGDAGRSLHGCDALLRVRGHAAPVSSHEVVTTRLLPLPEDGREGV